MEKNTLELTITQPKRSIDKLRFKELLKMNGIKSHAELANIVDCNAGHLSRCLCGHKQIGDRLLKDIANALHVSVEYLVGESDFTDTKEENTEKHFDYEDKLTRMIELFEMSYIIGVHFSPASPFVFGEQSGKWIFNTQIIVQTIIFAQKLATETTRHELNNINFLFLKTGTHFKNIEHLENNKFIADVNTKDCGFITCLEFLQRIGDFEKFVDYILTKPSIII